MPNWFIKKLFVSDRFSRKGLCVCEQHVCEYMFVYIYIESYILNIPILDTQFAYNIYNIHNPPQNFAYILLYPYTYNMFRQHIVLYTVGQ